MTNKQVEKVMHQYTTDDMTSPSRMYHINKQRAALICALSIVGGCSDNQIAQVLKKSRSAVGHHRTKHDQNLVSYDNYAELYGHAKRIIEDISCPEWDGEMDYELFVVVKNLNIVSASLRKMRQPRHSESVDKAIKYLLTHDQ